MPEAQGRRWLLGRSRPDVVTVSLMIRWTALTEKCFDEWRNFEKESQAMVSYRVGGGRIRGGQRNKYSPRSLVSTRPTLSVRVSPAASMIETHAVI